MDRTYQHIFTPLTIRGITLKNRIEIAPISVFDLDTTPERHPSERDMQFFRMRAMYPRIRGDNRAEPKC